MEYKKKIPKKIRKKMRKDNPSLFHFPLSSKSLDEKKEVAPLCYRCNKNKATKLCINCRKPICNRCETREPEDYCVPCRNEKYTFVTYLLE